MNAHIILLDILLYISSMYISNMTQRQGKSLVQRTEILMLQELMNHVIILKKLSNKSHWIKNDKTIIFKKNKTKHALSILNVETFHLSERDCSTKRATKAIIFSRAAGLYFSSARESISSSSSSSSPSSSDNTSTWG